MEGNEGAGSGEKYTKEQLDGFKARLLARDATAFKNEDGTEKTSKESIEIIRRILLDDYGVPSAEVNKWLNQSIERANPERFFDVAANIVKSAETKKNAPPKVEKREVESPVRTEEPAIELVPVSEVASEHAERVVEQRIESSDDTKVTVTIEKKASDAEVKEEEALAPAVERASIEMHYNAQDFELPAFRDLYAYSPAELRSYLDNRKKEIAELRKIKGVNLAKLNELLPEDSESLLGRFQKEIEKFIADGEQATEEGRRLDYGDVTMNGKLNRWKEYFTKTDALIASLQGEPDKKKATKKVSAAEAPASPVVAEVAPEPAPVDPVVAAVDEKLTTLNKSWEEGKPAVLPIAGNDNAPKEAAPEHDVADGGEAKKDDEQYELDFNAPDAASTPKTPEQEILEKGMTGTVSAQFANQEGQSVTPTTEIKVEGMKVEDKKDEDGVKWSPEFQAYKDAEAKNGIKPEEVKTETKAPAGATEGESKESLAPLERSKSLVAITEIPKDDAETPPNGPSEAYTNAREVWKAAREKNDALEMHYHAKLEDFYRTRDAANLFKQVGYGAQSLFGIDPKLTPELTALKAELYGAQDEYKAAGRNLAIEKYKDDPLRGARVLSRYQDLLAEKLVVGAINKRNAIQGETIKTLHPNGTLIENTKEFLKKSRGARIAAGILGYGAIGAMTGGVGGFFVAGGAKAVRIGLGFVGGAAAGMGTSAILDKTLVQGARVNVGETGEEIKSSFFAGDAAAQGAEYEQSVTRLKDAERTKKIVSGVAAGLVGFGAAGIDFDGEKTAPIDDAPKEPTLYKVQPGDNAWNIMEGEGKNPDVHSEVLFGEIPAGSRNIALDALFDYMETDKEFAKSVGMESEWPHRIYEGEELNLTLLDEKLREIAIEKGLISDTGVLSETSVVADDSRIEPASYMAADTSVEATVVDSAMRGSAELIPETTVTEAVLFAFHGETIIQMIDILQHAKAGDIDALTSLEAAGVTLDQLQEALNWVFEQGEGGHIEDRLTLAEYIGTYTGEGGGAIDGPESEGPGPESTVTDSGAEAAIEAARTALIDSIEHPDAGRFALFGARDFGGAFEKMNDLTFKEIIAVQDLTPAERHTEFTKLGVSEEQWNAWVDAANKLNTKTPVTDMNETLGGYVDRIAKGRAEAS